MSTRTRIESASVWPATPVCASPETFVITASLSPVSLKTTKVLWYATGVRAVTVCGPKVPMVYKVRASPWASVTLSVGFTTPWLPDIRIHVMLTPGMGVPSTRAMRTTSESFAGANAVLAWLSPDTMCRSGTAVATNAPSAQRGGVQRLRARSGPSCQVVCAPRRCR